MVDGLSMVPLVGCLSGDLQKTPSGREQAGGAVPPMVHANACSTMLAQEILRRPAGHRGHGSQQGDGGGGYGESPGDGALSLRRLRDPIIAANAVSTLLVVVIVLSRSLMSHCLSLDKGTAVVDASEAPAHQEGAADRSSDLIDLTGLTLADVVGLEDTAVARSLRRILWEIDRPHDAVAGFQSAM